MKQVAKKKQFLSGCLSEQCMNPNFLNRSTLYAGSIDKMTFLV